jgi:2-dehydropantoate 2-reductase
MIEEKRLNIAIFGVGAMGTLFGSQLSSVANVILFGNWPQQVETLQQNGLIVTHPDGSQSQYPLNVTNNLNDMPCADVVLILVKSHQTARAARQAANILQPDGIAITIQNGLGNLEKLAETVGAERATLGITAQGATIMAPGHLRHAGEGPTHLAALPGREERMMVLVELFNIAGLKTTLVDNADSLVWGKLAINAGINPLTALFEVPNGRLAEDERYQGAMVTAANEVAAVAAAQGIQLPFDVSEQVVEVAQATAQNRSSMLQDMSRGASTEIEAISGAVVHAGQQFGVPTPVNKILLKAVRDKELGRLTFARLNIERLLFETT